MTTSEPAEDGPAFLPLDRVADAVIGLGGHYNRPEVSVVERWLFAKFQGASIRGEEPGGERRPGYYSMGDCERFQRLWLEVDCPGVTPSQQRQVLDRGVFNPFSGKYKYRSGDTSWFRNSLDSQLNRNPRRVTAIMVRADEDDVKALAFTPDYLEALEGAIGGRIRLQDLSVWRYRHDRLPSGTTTRDLADLVVEELHLSEAEIRAVFTDAEEVLVGHGDGDGAGG